jgi:hypothetical protein
MISTAKISNFILGNKLVRNLVPFVATLFSFFNYIIWLLIYRKPENIRSCVMPGNIKNPFTSCNLTKINVCVNNIFFGFKRFCNKLSLWINNTAVSCDYPFLIFWVKLFKFIFIGNIFYMNCLTTVYEKHSAFSCNMLHTVLPSFA